MKSRRIDDIRNKYNAGVCGRLTRRRAHQGEIVVHELTEGHQHHGGRVLVVTLVGVHRPGDHPGRRQRPVVEVEDFRGAHAVGEQRPDQPGERSVRGSPRRMPDVVAQPVVPPVLARSALDVGQKRRTHLPDQRPRRVDLRQSFFHFFIRKSIATA